MESLERRRFVTEPYLYLTRDLAGLADSDAPPAGVPWRELDVVAAAALLRESYTPDGARHFALGHTVAAWERYVRNVVEQTGLGTFNPHATRLVRRRHLVDALVLMTSLSAETSHLAQVAVRPERRGEGLARALVSEACAVAAQQGFRRATLLVGANNIPARRLYDRLGFTEGPRFVAAHR
jgi:ribosomal protein S18 acetylase RimI-like enzyme